MCIRRCTLKAVRLESLTYSGQYFLNDVAVDVGQTEVTTAISVREAFVVQSEKVECRSVQIVNVSSFLDCAEAEIVRCAIGHAPLDTASREERRKPVNVMIAAIAKLLEATVLDH